MSNSRFHSFSWHCFRKKKTIQECMFLSVSHYDTRNFVNLRSSFSSRWDSESLRLFREKASSPQRECERFRVDITAFVFFLFLRKKISFPFLFFFFSFPRCLNDERFFVASTRAASFCIVILSLVASLTRHFPAPPSSVVPARRLVVPSVAALDS